MRDKLPSPPRYPQPVKMAAGETRYWCGCGHSSDAPLCTDPSCAPEQRRAYTAQRDEIALFCGCHGTRTPPLCDGAHAGLRDRPPWWRRWWRRARPG